MAPLTCASSWTRVAAIKLTAFGDSNRFEAIATSFFQVIPNRPGSLLGLKLTQMPGSRQTASKLLPPGSLQNAALHVFRTFLLSMIRLLTSRKALIIIVMCFSSVNGSQKSPSFVRNPVLCFLTGLLMFGMMDSLVIQPTPAVFHFSHIRFASQSV